MSLRNNLLLAARSLRLVLALPTYVVYLSMEHYSILFNSMHSLFMFSSFQVLYENVFMGLSEPQVQVNSHPQKTYIFARTFALSMRCPSSSCSATSRTGNLAGIIRRGVDSGITEYLEKSETPHFSRRKSSSVSRSPFTIWCGARSIARTASENIVYCSTSVLGRPAKG